MATAAIYQQPKYSIQPIYTPPVPDAQITIKAQPMLTPQPTLTTPKTDVPRETMPVQEKPLSNTFTIIVLIAAALILFAAMRDKK